MGKIFAEENGYYNIDCTNAVWATDEINTKYHMAKCFLSDVDWIMETKEKLFLVEYKNAKIEVLSIAEWNANDQYGKFPIRPCE